MNENTQLSIQIANTQVTVATFTNTEALTDLLRKIREMATAEVPDVTTLEGRKRIRARVLAALERLKGGAQ